MEISGEIRPSTSDIRLRIDCYQNFNPLPEKSEEMREKIKVFAEDGLNRTTEKTEDATEEVTSGRVSEIIASFSSPAINSCHDSRRRVQIPPQFMGENHRRNKNQVSIPAAFSKSSENLTEKKGRVAEFIDEKRRSLQSLGMKLSPQKYPNKTMSLSNSRLSEESVYSEFERYDKVYASKRSGDCNIYGGLKQNHQQNNKEAFNQSKSTDLKEQGIFNYRISEEPKVIKTDADGDSEYVNKEAPELLDNTFSDTPGEMFLNVSRNENNLIQDGSIEVKAPTYEKDSESKSEQAKQSSPEHQNKIIKNSKDQKENLLHSQPIIENNLNGLKKKEAENHIEDNIPNLEKQGEEGQEKGKNSRQSNIFKFNISKHSVESPEDFKRIPEHKMSLFNAKILADSELSKNAEMSKKHREKILKKLQKTEQKQSKYRKSRKHNEQKLVSQNSLSKSLLKELNLGSLDVSYEKGVLSLMKSPMRRKKRIEYISEKICSMNSSYMSHLLSTNMSRSKSVSQYLDLLPAGADMDEASDQISDIYSDQTIPDQAILIQDNMTNQSTDPQVLTNQGTDPHIQNHYSFFYYAF